MVLRERENGGSSSGSQPLQVDGGVRLENYMGLCWRLKKAGRWDEFVAARDGYIAGHSGCNRRDAAIAVYGGFKPDGGLWELGFNGWSTRRAGEGWDSDVESSDDASRASPAMLSYWKKKPEALRARLDRRRIELLNGLSDEPALSYEELTTWVSRHVSAHDVSMLKIVPPNRQAWSMLLWARENPDKFWATFHSVKKKEVEEQVDTKRRIDIDTALSVVYRAAQESVLDAAELDRETFGLPDMERAKQTILVAECGAGVSEDEE